MIRTPFPLLIARVGTAGIAAGAFWLSFTALEDLAVRSGVPASQAWVWPLIVDGLVLVATVAIDGLKSHRWYAWSLLAAGAVLSLTANALHATYTGELPIAVRILVGSVPALCLLASVHLMFLLSRKPVPSVQVVDVIEQPAEVTQLVTVARRDEVEVPDLGASFRAARAAAV